MVIENWSASVRPESKPAGAPVEELAASAVHGFANEDWVTEWFNPTLDGVNKISIKHAEPVTRRHTWGRRK